MSNLKSDSDRLVEELGMELGRQGRTLHVQGYGKDSGHKFSLKSRLTFGWVSIKTRLDYIAVGTKREWADKAGVSEYLPKPRSQFGEPGAHWIVHEDNQSERKKVVGYLARVCNARHS
jgi:hypothetical protein